jgi:hypothetical protein
VSSAVTPRKKIAAFYWESVSLQQNSQVFNHGNGSSRQLPFSVALADYHFFPDPALAVDIADVQSTGFINPTTAVETNTKQSAIALRLQPLSKQQLYFSLRENLGLPMSVNFHSATTPNTPGLASFSPLFAPFLLYQADTFA